MSHFSDALVTVTAKETAVPPTRLVAFVPITLALIGVAVVLAGGVSAGPKPSAKVATAAAPAIDPMVTGTIVTPANRAALAKLDD